jgi:nucleoside 2-deoxyribosyltransferase
MANIYLAHNWAAREYLRNVVVPELEERGHRVTSRWISVEAEHDNDNGEKYAVEDLEDIELADTLVFFAKQMGETPGAGKFVELGYAIRAGKRVIVVGEGRCVFYHLPSVRRVGVLEEVFVLL